MPILGIPIYWWIVGLGGLSVSGGAAMGTYEAGKEVGKGTSNAVQLLALAGAGVLIYKAVSK